MADEYSSNFVTSEEFEGIKDLLGSNFELKKKIVENPDVWESYDVILSDGIVTITYYKNKKLIVGGEINHPQFEQIYLSIDNFLVTNRKTIKKESSEIKTEEIHQKQMLNLNKKQVKIAYGLLCLAVLTIIVMILLANNAEKPPEINIILPDQKETKYVEKQQLSLQIIPHTDVITEQSFPAIVFGNGSVIHQTPTVTRGPIVIYENLTSTFSLYVHNDGPGIISLDTYVIKVISDNKTLQPVTIRGEYLGKLLEPNKESFKISAKFVGNSRMKPAGTIDFEIHHNDGIISKSMRYEYFEKRPFD